METVRKREGENHMENIETWIDGIFEGILPEGIIDIVFNLYEDGGNRWSLEMIGCSVGRNFAGDHR